MEYSSKNMNYIFYVEYFKDLELVSEGNIAVDKQQQENKVKLVQAKNALLCDFCFKKVDLFAPLKEVAGYQEYSLYTQYPGLLVGVGNPHQISEKGAAKLGFSFDYVTGLPYIPGSSLKGMLRSMFPGDNKKNSDEYEEMIREYLGKDADFDVDKLKNNIFEEGKDVFLGGYAVAGAGREQFLEMEYITSHKKKYKNPNPVSLVKVKPGVEFCFCYVLTDYTIDGQVVVSASEKLQLFKELILLAGIGAKTNVGYGKFGERRPSGNQKGYVSSELDRMIAKDREDKKNYDTTTGGDRQSGGFRPRGNGQQSNDSVPKCKNPWCNNKVKANPKGGFYPLCHDCNSRRQNSKK